jgi:hypothetical protein
MEDNELIEDNEPKDSSNLDDVNARITNEELIRWMTEGTNPYLSPRSDCG